MNMVFLCFSLWFYHQLFVFFRVSTPALGLWYDYSSTSDVTVKNMGRINWYQIKLNVTKGLSHYNYGAILPVQAASLPVQAASLPVQAASLPVQAASLPVQAASLPVQAASLPVQAASHYLRQCWLSAKCDPHEQTGEIWFERLTFSLKKMRLKMLSATCQPFSQASISSGFNLLTCLTILKTISSSSLRAVATPAGLPSIRMMLLFSLSGGMRMETPVSSLIRPTKKNHTHIEENSLNIGVYPNKGSTTCFILFLWLDEYVAWKSLSFNPPGAETGIFATN